MNEFYFESLKSNTSKHFESFFKIYQQSIEPREQKSREQIEKLVLRADYTVTLLMKDDVVLGFSMVFLSAPCKIGLLEYMAVVENHRSQGLGGLLLKNTFSKLKEAGDFRFGVIEVDSPESKVVDLKHRRIEFYRRHGCSLIDELDYILPLPGIGAPPKMNLMIYPLDANDVISRKMLGRWLKEIYQNVYSCSPEDERIYLMINEISDPIQLRKI